MTEIKGEVFLVSKYKKVAVEQVKLFHAKNEITELQKRIADLEAGLTYHQEQTRPIERTQKLLEKEHG